MIFNFKKINKSFFFYHFYSLGKGLRSELYWKQALAHLGSASLVSPYSVELYPSPTLEFELFECATCKGNPLAQCAQQGIAPHEKRGVKRRHTQHIRTQLTHCTSFIRCLCRESVQSL